MGMNPRLLRPLATGFDPRRISNLSVWLDATQIAAADAPSDQVENWRSLVGSLVFNQTGTPNNRPTLFESSSDVQTATRALINGKQAVFFDGTNDLLQQTGSATLSETEWSAFAVARRDSTTGFRVLFQRDPGGGGVRGPQYLRFDGSGNVEAVGFTSAGVAFTASSSAAVSTGQVVVMHAVQTASTLQAFLNNVGGSSVSGVQGSIATVATVSRVGALFQGYAAEILLYTRALSAAEQTAVYNYLRSRWGVT